MITPFTPAIRNTNKPRILIVDVHWNFSRWFVIFSPLIGVLLGFVAAFLASR